MRLLTAAITQVCHCALRNDRKQTRSGGKNITYKEEFIQKESESRRPREETFGEIVKFKVRDGVLFYSSKEKDLRVVAEKEKVDILQSYMFNHMEATL